MRALAEFIMRGRMQAVTIALLGSWVPLLTPASLGLVTLRKGWQEGLIVTLWASLPAFVGLWFGSVGKSLALASIVAIYVSYFVALVLRFSISWSLTLAFMVVVSSLSGLLIGVSVQDVSEELRGFVGQLLTPPEAGDAQTGFYAAESAELKSAEGLEALTSVTTIGLIAFWIGASAIAGLVVARWWQALLYNPGGFKTEFHQLRLDAFVAIGSFLGVSLCLLGGKEYYLWVCLFCLPLLFASLGLAHCFVAAFRLNTSVLVVMYFVLFFVQPLGLLFSVAGLSDVWLNYRKRFNLKQ